MGFRGGPGINIQAVDRTGSAAGLHSDPRVNPPRSTAGDPGRGTPQSSGSLSSLMDQTPTIDNIFKERPKSSYTSRLLGKKSPIQLFWRLIKPSCLLLQKHRSGRRVSSGLPRLRPRYCSTRPASPPSIFLELVFIPHPSTVPAPLREDFRWRTKIHLHHLLLNGTLVFAEFVHDKERLQEEFKTALDRKPDVLTVPAGFVMSVDSMHDRKRTPFVMRRAQGRGRILVDQAVDYLTHRVGKCAVHRLYYSDGTFDRSAQPRNWSTTRMFLYELQEGRCPCGEHDGPLSPADMHCDHLVPRDQGGNHVLTNLHMVCEAKNLQWGRKEGRTEHHQVGEAFRRIFPRAWTTQEYRSLICNPRLTPSDAARYLAGAGEKLGD